MPKFATPDWLAAYRDAINASPEISEATKDWERDIAIVVEAEADKGVPIDLGAVFKIDHGRCSEATIASVEEAERAMYAISAPYSRWKDVLRGKLDPIRGMLQGKLKVKGDLHALAREVKAAEALVRIASEITTEFPDE